MALLEINWKPKSRDLRQFALIWLVFFGLLGAYFLWRSGSLRPAYWIWGIAGPIGLIGVAFPGFMRPIFTLWMYLAFPIGWTISHLIMLVIYYLIITPIGLAMKAVGYDPMKRKIDKVAKTYWLPRDTNVAAARYFQQF